jgi:hypothetical protein
VSHVNAATHESALPNPPTNRARTSIQTASASPKARLVRDIMANPTSAVAFTPMRAAR